MLRIYITLYSSVIIYNSVYILYICLVYMSCTYVLYICLFCSLPGVESLQIVYPVVAVMYNKCWLKRSNPVAGISGQAGRSGKPAFIVLTKLPVRQVRPVRQPAGDLQESGEDDPGRCCAVHARPDDVVIVPPGYVHATVNADPRRSMTFGAWCVRDYGFDYRAVRSHGGIAFFPYMDGDTLKWRENPAYQGGELIIKEARIYTQFRKAPDRFLFVSHPESYPGLWKDYI